MINTIDNAPMPYCATGHVHNLLYDNVSELTGAALTLADGTPIVCLPGSVAMKPGIKDLKQLSSAGTWVDVG